MQLEKNNNHQQCPVKGEIRNLAGCVISKQKKIANLSIWDEAAKQYEEAKCLSPNQILLKHIDF